jgi:long-chain acyl-CoA synthetase
MPGRIVFTVLQETAKKEGNATALHQPRGKDSGGGYQTYSWNDWLQISSEIALGLHAFGLRKGEIVAILCETRAEFYLADLGTMGAGGVAGALYTAYPIPDLAKNIVNAQPRFLFVEDEKSCNALRNALQTLGQDLPAHTILLTGNSEDVMTLDELREKGRTLVQADSNALSHLLDSISPDDPAILYLTSGATGEPKMGLTTHAAILANLEMGPKVLPITPQDSTLVFLPSAHIAQRIVLELVPMRMGTPVWFSESLQKLPTELRAVRPTIFLAPPRVWERMYSTIQTELKKRPPFIQKGFHGALGLGMAASRLRDAGKPVPFWMKGTLQVADRLFFSKVRERLGGRIRVAASGAAPLGKDLADFYSAIGMPLIEGYGLTEAGILCFNPIANPRSGSIGKALPGVELRLASDNELLVRSPCMFQGYYKDEAATRSVLDGENWFSTGDLAEVDAEGYWYITGRKKELIVSSNGKKIYPARIENLFKMEPLINQVVLIGDKKPYVTALLTVNAAQVETPGNGNQEAVTKAVQGAVSRVNKQLADFEQIRRFRVLERDLTIEAGELTPTMKIRRGRVLENYASLVSDLYLGK